MPDQCTLMLPSPRIPDLDRLVLGAGDKPKSIRGKRPDTLDMAEEAVDASPRGNMPQADCVVERAGEHELGGLRPV